MTAANITITSQSPAALARAAGLFRLTTRGTLVLRAGDMDAFIALRS